MSAPAAESFVREALSRGGAAGPGPPERLWTADARIVLEMPGAVEPIVLDLTRPDPASTRRWRPRRRLPPSCEPQEIHLQLSLDDAVTLARGRLPLPAALAAGTVRARGPVRRLLAVDPVLRAWLRGDGPGSRFRSDAAPPDVAPPRAAPAPRGAAGADPADLDPDWLAVETRELETTIGEHRTLKGASLRVPEGVISVLIGPSGAGKSVLLAHLVGLLMPDTGDTIVRGRTLNRLTRSELLELRMDVGVLFEDGAPLSSMDLFDNVAFPLRQNTNLVESVIRDRVSHQLARLGLSAQSHDRPHELSPSQRRRAGLARALALEPTLLVCDEPDFGFEVPGALSVAQLLLDHHAGVGGTVIVVTDNLDLAAAIADHVSVIEDGRVVASHLIGSTEPSANPYLRRFRELAEV